MLMFGRHVATAAAHYDAGACQVARRGNAWPRTADRVQNWTLMLLHAAAGAMAEAGCCAEGGHPAVVSAAAKSAIYLGAATSHTEIIITNPERSVRTIREWTARPMFGVALLLTADSGREPADGEAFAVPYGCCEVDRFAVFSW
jgi:hypothetical protein